MKVFARKILCSAVESGNIRLASRIIQCGAQLQDDDPSHSQRWADYLSNAVYHGHGIMVKLLCEARVPPKIKNRWSWNARWGLRLPILYTFLKFGANPESFITEEDPGFPLIDAALDGNLQAVGLLLNAKARVDLYLPQYYGSAMQAAVLQGHLEVAKYLIQYGADINVPCGLPLSTVSIGRLAPFQTPVQLAAETNNFALLQCLLERGASAMVCPVSTHPDFKHFCSYEATYRWIEPEDYTHRYKSDIWFYTSL